jgi:drug/metabolite transporter (DMT)-like permease
MDAFIGQIAALLAAITFSVTSVCYTFAGRKINSVAALAMSLPISWLILVGLHRLTLGEFFPTTATPERGFLLATSGILAYVVSSYFMLNAYQHIGPRLTMLIATFAPVLGTVLAWLFLGQALPANAILGIGIVIFGIVWVMADPDKSDKDKPALNLRQGIFDASLATLTQGFAFIFASQGVQGDFPPFSALLIRLTAGIAALWVWLALQRKLWATATIFQGQPNLFWQLVIAAVTGPVIAGSFIMLSFQLIPVGISTTLSHTTAIMLIPIGYFVFKERITPRAVVGTLVTLVGIGVLFIL